MKDYLEKRREELRKQGGFTLMEMLIVVAIIAVLVAIAIPVFTSQLERSREATDEANIRSAYAELVAAYMVDGMPTNVNVPVRQTIDKWQSHNDDASISIGTNITVSGKSGNGSIPVTAKTGGSYNLKIDSAGTVTCE